MMYSTVIANLKIKIRLKRRMFSRRVDSISVFPCFQTKTRKNDEIAVVEKQI